MVQPVTGANMLLAMAREATYGEAPAAGPAWFLIPAVSLGLTETQRFGENNLLGQGNQPLRPVREQSDYGGGVTVPVDLRAIGYWLSAAFGDPVTAAEAPLFRHTWKSGTDTLPSFAIERIHPEATPALVTLYTGLRVNSLTITFDPTGQANLDLECLYAGQNRHRDAPRSDGAPAIAVDRFSQFENYIERDGTALGRITQATIPYGLSLEAYRYLGGGGRIGEIAPGLRTSSGRLTARFADWGLFDLARDQVTFALEIGFRKAEAAGGNELRFRFDQVEFGNPSDPASGGGGIAATFPLMPSKDQGTGTMLTIELLNDVADYTP
jgi:tail tube protein